MDRIEEIKNGSFTAGDVIWLVSEVERLRAERNSDDLYTLLDAIIHQRRGAMTELNEIHDILAEALGYQKAPTLEEDPNCPCPGAYVTGDHIAVTLAVEAAKKLRPGWRESSQHPGLCTQVFHGE
jgi:hypothetical protein